VGLQSKKRTDTIFPVDVEIICSKSSMIDAMLKEKLEDALDIFIRV
jgi:hypothetical protein